MTLVESEVFQGVPHLNAFAGPAASRPIATTTTPDTPQTVEEERKRISREMHDGVAQELQAIVMHLRIALSEYNSEAASAATETALAIARRGIDLTRVLLADLHTPPHLSDAPSESLAGLLQDSLMEATRYSGVEVIVEVEQGLSTSPAVDYELRKMVREIATNTVRHAAAKLITCVVSRPADNSAYLIEIWDDGVGFDSEHGSPGCGIRGLKERAKHIGGEVYIKSIKAHGTLVSIALPAL